MRRRTKWWIFLSVLAAAVLFARYSYNARVEQHRQEAIDACKDKIAEICQEYDIQDVSTDISMTQGTIADIYDCDYYYIHVKGNGAKKLKKAECYEMVKRLKGVEVHFGDTRSISMTSMTFDGHRYDLGFPDRTKLTKDGKTIYSTAPSATPKPSPKPSGNYSGGGGGSTGRKSSKEDPFDVYDYSHPDDFYYDHYDDFYDFEDAEDYYYSHTE